jgi:hypothetical protein
MGAEENKLPPGAPLQKVTVLGAADRSREIVLPVRKADPSRNIHSSPKQQHTDGEHWAKQAIAYLQRLIYVVSAT